MKVTHERIAPGDPGYAEALREIAESERTNKHTTTFRCGKCGEAESYRTAAPMTSEDVALYVRLPHSWPPASPCGGPLSVVLLS